MTLAGTEAGESSKIIAEADVRNDWLQVGVVVGALFGLTTGLLLSVDGTMPEIGASIGVPTLLGGWVLHLTLSFVTCIAFAAALSTSRLSGYAGRLRTLLPMGLAFGLVAWVVLDMFLLAYVGVAVDAPGAVFPNFALEFAVINLVFGAVTALFYYATRRWLITGRPAAQ
jgi:uncharacterized membrane protein